MRTVSAIAIGILVGAAAAWGVFVADDRGGRVTVPQAARPPAKTAPLAAAEPADPVYVPTRSAPTTPDYGPSPAAPQAIYRCKTRTGTTYSNAPCPGGSIVDESSAVGGFVSRPSDRPAQLVAEGWRADAPVQPVYRAPVAPVAAIAAVDCAQLRRQIVALDAEMLRPNEARRLDELRAVRQDVRTSMARLHC